VFNADVPRKFIVIGFVVAKGTVFCQLKHKKISWLVFTTLYVNRSASKRDTHFIAHYVLVTFCDVQPTSFATAQSNIIVVIATAGIMQGAFRPDRHR